MTDAFDLLGDPIPENHGKPGRPAHIPTQKNRNRVMLLLAMGWSDAKISAALGITEPTLRKHYFRELRARDAARARVKAANLDQLWDQAKAGKVENSSRRKFRPRFFFAVRAPPMLSNPQDHSEAALTGNCKSLRSENAPGFVAAPLG